MDALQGTDVVLRRVALSDLGAIGYLPAAEAIATAPVESSFKLIALKGLLEHQLDPALPNTLSPDAIRVMNLMDSLL
jgi:phycocyanobilin lyase alpha subunit